ncbi:MAG: YfhO family protein [Flavobacteriales bacterium]|nr:YfhO family protein [Flavobacteriales bacterium]
MNIVKKIMPHAIVVGLFVLISIIYFNPLLSGKKLYQGDISNFKGMAKEIQDFRETHNGEEPYWTNSMFGGMPAYQISVLYNYDVVKKLDNVIRFLPHPASYLFLYFISFYFMMLLLGNDWRLSLLGALAFGLSTYFLIILEAGHNAKAHAIAYFPMITAGIILSLRGKLIVGGLITALFMALEINANHFQMTYYLGLLIMILGGMYLYDAIKEKTLVEFSKNIAVLLVAVLLAFGANATKLMTTYEYTKYSTRGPSELTIDSKELDKTDGLDKAYVTQWSYGVLESMNLMIPNFMGGASGETLAEDSNLANALKGKAPQSQINQIISRAPTYWGEQPFTSGPAYIGSIVVFLFVLGLFIVDGKMKWWLLSGTIMSLALSWGKNFMPLTDFMLDYFPMYNKFRAVASIQVIAEFTLPFLAVLALKEWFFGEKKLEDKQKSLLYSFAATGGLALIFVLFGSVLFDFTGPADGQYAKMGLLNALIEDRASMMQSDSLRSFAFITVSAFLLYLFLKKKVSMNIAVGLIAFFIVMDLGGVDKRYLNNDSFVSKRKVDNPFPMTNADKEILQDKSIFRVYNASVNTMSNSSTSFYHQSVGGYHGAKLKRYQELWDMQLTQNNQQVLNMLNVKYFIVPNDGRLQVHMNPMANGNAWFVDKVKFVNDADEEMTALGSFNSSAEAVVDKRFESSLSKANTLILADDANIELTHYQANEIRYKSVNSNDGLAVFSEIYYPKGWHATIDGEEVGISRANFVLRTLWVPKGEHEIIFKFQPEIVQTGDKIMLGSNVLLFGLLLFGIIFSIKRKEE